MRTFLMSGGHGFMSAHLCRALASPGGRLLVLDDLATGRLDNLPVVSTICRPARNQTDGLPGRWRLCQE